MKRLTYEEMIKIAKKENDRHKMTKAACDHCIPDELMQFDNQIIEILEELKEGKLRYGKEERDK